MLWKPIYLEFVAVQMMVGIQLANCWSLCLTIQIRGKEMNAEEKGTFFDKNGKNITKSPVPMKLP